MKTYATQNPIAKTAMLFGREPARSCFKNVHIRTFQRKTKAVREIELKKRNDKIFFLFNQGFSINKISKIVELDWHWCKKILQKEGLVPAKVDTEKVLSEFYLVDLPNRTKTSEILEAEKKYKESGKNLQKLIKKCEKEKVDNRLFRQKYKQYKFQVEVKGRRASVNRLAELLGWSSVKTKKVAKRLRLQIFI
ncbi:hypothetical protein WAF17_21095 [Bernardetia sp. ABR2-2B]|uniref:hypothetical protein n=1 Tax=Bernardetia sp. ABR2-2B TaxID=3127472 RepID=UPI0030CC3E1E